MVTWQELHEEEREWVAKVENNEFVQWKIEEIKEEYADHFGRSLRFIQRLEEQFHGHHHPHIYHQAMEEMIHHSRDMVYDLEYMQENLKRENVRFRQELDDISHHKRIVSYQEERGSRL
ncbi:DUF3958 family protein [Listeria fleischmannii]|uniref:DUF3958 family protein n=1 Tax=Listeria fleischmannii TaxID=1069827 RepID=A0A841YH39_9LIST|nr:DUF3958 family protein [Listeria fleischmannii]EIA19124.1 hypothetical protein KKC_14130 [Listeria fleischmannii subsp. coloradonensis]MBC1399802.1 DUF3958 family protein [Listeria fleischmannii]MBC1428111.1 DUF3958 family protein [Listeria fleischmannii]STY35002.1 Uncharacterised protein [Listeria fleischmannii subsp. coloradonensis]